MVNKNSFFAKLSTVATLVAISGAALTFAPEAEAQRRRTTEQTPSEYLGSSWNHHIFGPFVTQLGRTPDQHGSCQDFYGEILQKREMKIVLGLGYYDSSEGETHSIDIPDGRGGFKKVEYGLNATIDNATEALYREILTARCKDDLQLCGFKEENQGRFVKSVRGPDRKKIRVVLEMKSSSISPEHSVNTGSRASEQLARSEATANWFFGSVSSADLLIYNGHSRKGGGPDFYPPKLLKNLHVNYAYYHNNKPGITRLLSSLRAAPSKPTAIIMASCDSNKHFAKDILAAAPGIALATTTEVPPTGNAPIKGAMAAIDSMLRFKCGSEFKRALDFDADMRDFFIVDGMN